MSRVKIEREKREKKILFALLYLRLGEDLSEVWLEASQRAQALRPGMVKDQPDGPELSIVAQHKNHRLPERPIPDLLRREQQAPLVQAGFQRTGAGQCSLTR